MKRPGTRHFAGSPADLGNMNAVFVALLNRADCKAADFNDRDLTEVVGVEETQDAMVFGIEGDECVQGIGGDRIIATSNGRCFLGNSGIWKVDMVVVPQTQAADDHRPVRVFLRESVILKKLAQVENPPFDLKRHVHGNNRIRKNLAIRGRDAHARVIVDRTMGEVDFAREEIVEVREIFEGSEQFLHTDLHILHK